jgi:beta-phosphoglucomutase-like phosphatase (HAD superfamily)
VQAALEAAGILGLFDAVVSVEDVERGKPAPDLYLVALDRAPGRSGGLRRL